ncbi:hypothetical protein ACTWQL_18615 [Pseudalkalibacillus sp. R45]|uniref:hypothetical protein n=1 Tax=Pseudalkalibacillus sp. R45 TaxID=3457433 RepID=UPI003FCE0A61
MIKTINIPILYFQLNRDYEIIRRSKVAVSQFPDVEGFLELIDGDSVVKAKRYLDSKNGDIEIELVMKTFQSPYSLFQVRVSWNMDHTAEVVCLEKTGENDRLFTQIDRLRNRLEDTNYELLEKKDDLEKAMKRVNELSGPFISLTDSSALVPLFGDLTAEKVETISDKILTNAHNKNQDSLYFDFTGVGEIKKEGFEGLQRLFKTLWYMGEIEAIIIGISPQQAIVMNQLDTEYHLTFVSTLKEALKSLNNKTKTGA